MSYTNIDAGCNDLPVEQTLSAGQMEQVEFFEMVDIYRNEFVFYSIKWLFDRFMPHSLRPDLKDFNHCMECLEACNGDYNDLLTED